MKNSYTAKQKEQQKQLEAYQQEEDSSDVATLAREISLVRSLIASNASNVGVVKSLSDTLARLCTAHDRAAIRSHLYVHKTALEAFVRDFISLVNSRCQHLAEWPSIIDELKPELFELATRVQNPKALSQRRLR